MKSYVMFMSLIMRFSVVDQRMLFLHTACKQHTVLLLAVRLCSSSAEKMGVDSVEGFSAARLV